MKHTSNVIYVDFAISGARKNNQLFSKLLNTLFPVENINAEKGEWPEKLTPSERHEQIKRDLEFLRQINTACDARK